MARIAVLLSKRTISFWERVQIRKKTDVKRVPDPSDSRPDNYWATIRQRPWPLVVVY